MAVKILFEAFELNVAERSLKKAGVAVPLGGGASDISFGPHSSGLESSFIAKFSMNGGGSLPFSEPVSATAIEGGVRPSNSAKLLSADAFGSGAADRIGRL
ncbi:hypothetical protein GWG65_17920 [Bradyrhizobium sp. CSA207]|uniref:hypothetical protein n=1 Tax=Bradyrhizobium sp. CSA207 TaxID=2698826 RepID=UPI0023B051BB|nr:hypothetical protein [Bradyrhizobium sp. CSA207]MDE5443291.1 hypothetical protein [Bradyrhizobium sp. CSA207]